MTVNLVKNQIMKVVGWDNTIIVAMATLIMSPFKCMMRQTAGRMVQICSVEHITS